MSTGRPRRGPALNPEQEAAVRHRGGPLLVLAGAGTGKTQVITHRVAALLDEGVYPWRVLAVTFTNRAATEMRERIGRLCGERDDLDRLWVGTFHSICSRILRRHGEAIGLTRNFSIYDTTDQRSLMKHVLRELNISDKKCPPRLILGHLDKVKNKGKGAKDLHREPLDGLQGPLRDMVLKAALRYEQRLRFADAVDFGDLLVLAVKLLREAGQGAPGSQLAGFDPVARLRTQFLHIVVDEFQDTNPVQGQLVELLGKGAELCVVGDDDQSIYGWRGADVAQILDFPQTHPGCELIRLEQNYRSTGHILSCADGVIRRNTGRLGKTLWSDLGEGEKVRVLALEDERMEARWIASAIAQHVATGGSPEDVAVFYRTHAQSRALEEALRHADIHYNIFGGLRFFDRKEIKDLVGYLRLLVTPHGDVDLLRVINTPSRKIGNVSMSRVQEYATAKGTSLWDALPDAEKAGVNKAASKRIRLFRALIEELTDEVGSLTLGELAAQVLERTGYREMLSLDPSDEARSRLENLQEFIGDLDEFSEEQPGATLADYLEQVSLATDVDGSAWNHRAVTLMTVHSAKGLEFERVFLTGMEERVFPHARSMDPAEPSGMEEERRLAYVAITRAKRGLTLTWARRRRLFGQTNVGTPSRFLGDLPRDHVQGLGQPSSSYQSRRPRPHPRQAARTQSWDDDIVYDAGYSGGSASAATASAASTQDEAYTADDPAAGEGVTMYIGMPVRHRKFGVGDLLGWEGSEANLKLVLRFPNAGVKTILARFCEPI